MDYDVSFATNEWRTEKGQDHPENRDACGIHISSKQTVAVIVDAANSGRRGVEYARWWVQQLIDIAKSDDTLTPESLISAMRRSHSQLLGAGFLKEIAAYAVLVIESGKQLAWALNCGDCRVGSIFQQGDVRWLTPVHTGANPLGEEFTVDHVSMENRHLLTRRLRVHHFDEPKLTTFDYPQGISWLLATDGYWIEHLSGTRRDTAPEDDASVLVLTLPAHEIRQATHCTNFICRSSDNQRILKPKGP